MHLPNESEWQVLLDFAGGDKIAGKKLKATSGWSGNGNGTNAFGFSALPGGNGNSYGDFFDLGKFGIWWSSSSSPEDWGDAFDRGVLYSYPNVNWNYNRKSDLFSVRCVQDNVKKIAIYNGRVYLEMEKFTTPFYGISMRFTDKNLNLGSGGYLEVRKVKNGYAIDREDNVYSTLDGGLESYLKDYLERMSEDFYRNNFHKDAYWPIFVEEGKVKLFIDIIKSFIDDEFLNAPFNEEWS